MAERAAEILTLTNELKQRNGVASLPITLSFAQKVGDRDYGPNPNPLYCFYM
jgi:hypothetical protein